MLNPSPLEAAKLCLTYKSRAVKTLALSQVDISIQAYKINVVWGPNGAGKSSLLKALVGLVKLDSGAVTKAANTRTAFLPQKKELNLDLPPHRVSSGQPRPQPKTFR